MTLLGLVITFYEADPYEIIIIQGTRLIIKIIHQIFEIKFFK